VVALLERVAATTGCPKRLCADNGPEFVSKALDAWAHRRGVQLVFSRPGKPTDNPFAEAFNSRFRDECLDQHWFASLEEAQATIEAWRIEDQHRAPARRPGSADAGGGRERLGPGHRGRGLTQQVDQETGADQTTDGLS
jgi:putative transposase